MQYGVHINMDTRFERLLGHLVSLKYSRFHKYATLRPKSKPDKLLLDLSGYFSVLKGSIREIGY